MLIEVSYFVVVRLVTLIYVHLHSLTFSKHSLSIYKALWGGAAQKCLPKGLGGNTFLMKIFIKINLKLYVCICTYAVQQTQKESRVFG